MRMYRRWLALGLFLLPCALLLACDGSARKPAADAAVGTSDTGPTPTADFTPAGCTSAESAPAVNVTCGFVRVPERHDDPAAGTIRVRVAEVEDPNAKGARLDDPIVFLDGGTGGSSIANALYYASWAVDRPLKRLLARRKLIAIDLRGSGGSTPSLACAATGPQPVPKDSEGSRLEAEIATAVSDCRQSVASGGASLDAYGTSAAARDVAAVIRALGLRSFNLVGVSYGARVALEVLREGVPGLRAVVLDGARPPGADVLASESANLARALDAVIKTCEATAACAPQVPALRLAVPEIVAKLFREPVDVDTHGGTVTLDDRSFLQALVMALADGDLEGLLPRHLLDARAGELGYFAALLGAPRGRGSVGVNLSVVCAEQMAFTTPAQIEAAAAAVAPPFGAALYARFYGIACPIWKVPAAPASLRAPVSARVPALLLTGSLDPTTSPAWAAEVAATLAGAHTIELPGHGVAVVHNTCGATLAARFLDDPSVALTAGACISPD